MKTYFQNKEITIEVTNGCGAKCVMCPRELLTQKLDVTENLKALCDTLIINLENKLLATKLVNTMKDLGIGSKNVTDSIEWRFA